MAVKVRDDNIDFPDAMTLDDEQANGTADLEASGDVPASDSGDWVDALIEHGELSAIREALSDSQNAERRSLTKWMRAEEKYGGKLRNLRATYETDRSTTHRLFSAATRGLI